MEIRKFSPEYIAPQSNSISQNEFRSGFLDIRKRHRENLEATGKYNLGERVTRNNFVSMLIDSFAKSRGFPIIQHTYFSWLQANTGFDFKQTIRNYLDTGGWECLSSHEQAAIRNAFVRVSDHEKFVNEIELSSKFDKQVGGHRLDMDYAIKPLIPNEELVGMSKEKFLNRIHEEYRILKVVNEGI